MTTYLNLQPYSDQQNCWIDAFYRATLCCRPVSVCLSVRLSRWCIVSKRLKISSNFFFDPVAPSL